MPQVKLTREERMLIYDRYKRDPAYEWFFKRMSDILAYTAMPGFIVQGGVLEPMPLPNEVQARIDAIIEERENYTKSTYPELLEVYEPEPVSDWQKINQYLQEAEIATFQLKHIADNILPKSFPKNKRLPRKAKKILKVRMSNWMGRPSMILKKCELDFWIDWNKII